jgi:hypothetical protein
LATLALTRRRPTVPVLLILLANLAFSLISQRNIELFALVALPLLALTYDEEWRRLPVLRRAKEVFQREHAGSYSGLGAALCSLLLIALALAGGTVAGVEVVPGRFDPKVFPVNAVAKARAEGLDGKLFNNFIWGGYLLHAWPEQPVFIDGGTDHYGDELFDEYVRVWNLDPGWRDVLDRRGIDLALVPPNSRLAEELTQDQGWGVWYCDSTAALLRKSAESRIRPGGHSRMGTCGALAAASR